MIKLKKHIIILIFTGIISMPVAANANVVTNSESNIVNTKSVIHKPLEDREKIKEDYFKTFEKADKYVPGIKIKGEELYNIRHELKKELREAIREKQSHHLEENQDKPREGIDKEKVEKEKIEKEDLNLKDKHRFKDEEIKIQNEKTRKAYRDFVKAVDSGDKESINKTYNIFEENSKSLNELLKKKIKELKSQ
ncbi:hypothetical protein CLHOM_01590 [Clostridium homopropionicum DSM 5847]|uniref:DUF4142 domain-containing protein n=1 Tax=Clostridium homopropionicum DSM 5847 TaxID=1121318 RepID=A0A0L6ZFC3_9CLOT|nr:hypothetical protein [Clostridium homopropionicum]KOA21488.1 hypothetical protein CLHOM_01590 [Clostridium homopropionicum DSM 5847]SFG08082.1 hypothetical protein SAMN04488501_10562 [Clostridium homopropionicum]